MNVRDTIRRTALDPGNNPPQALRRLAAQAEILGMDRQKAQLQRHAQEREQESYSLARSAVADLLTAQIEVFGWKRDPQSAGWRHEGLAWTAEMLSPGVLRVEDHTGKPRLVCTNNRTPEAVARDVAIKLGVITHAAAHASLVSPRLDVLGDDVQQELEDCS